jgi:polyisoprenoid-binding protein YceI
MTSFSATARAFAQQVILLPPGSQVELRAYGLGVIPFDGRFTRFHGLIRYNAAKPGLCQVMLNIEAASLVMDDASMNEAITGPEFMDVTRFPDMAFEGDCQDDGITGTLHLHGQTHPFLLDVTRSANRMTAIGHLRRAVWGITARPFTAGSTIRIRVDLPDPANGPHT